jgi:hypothetical protein
LFVGLQIQHPGALALQRARGPAVHGYHVGTRPREGHKRQFVRARGPEYRAVRSREACRPSLGVQPVVERCPSGDDTAARTRPSFQDDDRCAGLVKKISCAQAGETGTDDDNGLVGIERTRGDPSNGGRGERKPTRRLLKKSSAIHVVLFVGRDAVPPETEASWQAKLRSVKEERALLRRFVGRNWITPKGFDTPRGWH